MTQETRPLFQQVQALRDAQAARSGAELERLVLHYQNLMASSTKDLNALVQKLMDKYGGSPAPTAAEVYRLRQYQDLIANIQNQLDRYGNFLGKEVDEATSLEVKRGIDDAMILGNLAAREAGVNIAGRWQTLSPVQVETMMGFLDPKGALYNKIGQLGGWTSQQVADKMIEGIAKGFNPKTTAKELTRTLSDGMTEALGMGLTSAMTLMRTSQLWSYREANRQSYLNSGGMVQSWVWHAEVATCCGSCLAMHGSVHSLDETLDDHHNGRCAMIPWVVGAPNPVGSTGEDYLATMTDAEMDERFGKGVAEMMRNGEISLSDIPKKYDNEVYGEMTGSRTLKDLRGSVGGISSEPTLSPSPWGEFSGKHYSGPRVPKEELDKAAAENLSLIQRELGGNVTEKQLQDALRDIFLSDKSDFIVSAPSSVVQKILNDGRFRTQFEVPKGGRMQNTFARVMAETNGMGLPEDLDPMIRPVYGWLNNPDLYGRFDPSRGYGDARFVLKKSEIIDRTTFNVGDSIGVFAMNSAKASPILEPSVASFDYQQTATIDSILNKKPDATTYIELQFQGGLSTDTIDRVVLSGYSMYPQELLDALAERGIQVEYGDFR